jgi:hypothetical protein
VVDWTRPARRDPQASLGRFSPELELDHARRARAMTRAKGAPPASAPRQSSLDAARRAADPREGPPVAVELRPTHTLTSLHVQRPPVARRNDDRVREALLAACAQGAERDGAVLEAARECAIPASALGFVEALLSDLVLEGALTAYGDVLYARRQRRRKVVAVEVGEDDLMDLLSRGHRVLELK